jgi:hypothetical protein
VYGSFTMGSFLPGESDLDVLLVTATRLSDAVRAELQSGLAQITLPDIVNGLDFVAISSEAAAHTVAATCWEAALQVTKGAEANNVQSAVQCDRRLPLDLALARHHGRALAGPPATEVIAPISVDLVLTACRENVRRWANREVFHHPVSGILNACRAWRFAVEGTLVSKPDGGRWVLARKENSLVRGAVAHYEGEAWQPVPNERVKAFLEGVQAELEGIDSVENHNQRHEQRD